MSLLDFFEHLRREMDPNFRDTHKHRCGYAPRGEPRVYGCGFVWEHDRPRGATEKQYEDAHRCPECKRVNTWRYFGRVPVGQKRLKQENKQ